MLIIYLVSNSICWPPIIDLTINCLHANSRISFGRYQESLLKGSGRKILKQIAEKFVARFVQEHCFLQVSGQFFPRKNSARIFAMFFLSVRFLREMLFLQESRKISARYFSLVIYGSAFYFWGLKLPQSFENFNTFYGNGHLTNELSEALFTRNLNAFFLWKVDLFSITD